MSSSKKTTTIQTTKKTKVRLESLAKFGETMENIIEMLLYHFAKPKKMSGGIYGNRTIYPSFEETEEKGILQRLEERRYEPIYKTPRILDKEMKKV